MASDDASPIQARYRHVLAWRAEGLNHAALGHRLGVSRERARGLAVQAQRWQERMLMTPLTTVPRRA